MLIRQILILESILLLSIFISCVLIVYNTLKSEVSKIASAGFAFAVAVFPQIFFILYLYKFGKIEKNKEKSNVTVGIIISSFLSSIIISPLAVSYATTDTIEIIIYMHVLVPTIAIVVYLGLFQILGFYIPNGYFLYKNS